jgi:hypothetical protein
MLSGDPPLPPPSPLYPGRLRPPPATRCVADEPPFDDAPLGPHRSTICRRLCSPPTSLPHGPHGSAVDPLLAGAPGRCGAAALLPWCCWSLCARRRLAWPWLGAAMAGLCRRAATVHHGALLQVRLPFSSLLLLLLAELRLLLRMERPCRAVALVWWPLLPCSLLLPCVCCCCACAAAVCVMLLRLPY